MTSFCFKTNLSFLRALRNEMITLAHEGHQGVVRAKQRLRTKVWWPRLSHDVEKFIQHCHPCQTAEPLQKSTPLRMILLPKEPWLLLDVVKDDSRLFYMGLRNFKCCQTLAIGAQINSLE